MTIEIPDNTVLFLKGIAVGIMIGVITLIATAQIIA